MFYVLKDRKAVPVSDVLDWGMAFEKSERRVADDYIDGSRVSTVFLGLDHSYGGGPPMLFETMVFGGPLDEGMERCTTWEQAETQHAAMCARVREGGGE